MGIGRIADQALRTGLLTPAMEAEIERHCGKACEITVDDYVALVRLRKAVASGSVTAFRRRESRNVMEELVTAEIVSRLSGNRAVARSLDVGDIAAYALNRLPPLYATTEEGAEHQRVRARQVIHDGIQQKVEEAIDLTLRNPCLAPERRPLEERRADELLSGWISRLEHFEPWS